MVTWNNSTKIVGPSHGKLTDVINYAVANHAARIDFTKDYITTVYALCYTDDMPDAAVVIAQSIHETTEVATGYPWASSWWKERGNPAGIGITGDRAQNNASKTFTSGGQAARAHVAHLLLYATGEVNRGGLKPSDDPRYDAYREAHGSNAKATTVAGLTNTWGMDDGYTTKLLSKLNSVFKNAEVNPVTPAPAPEIPSKVTKMYKTRLAGTNFEIETSFPIEVAIVPENMTNQRSGITPSTPRYWVQHETGNTTWGANTNGEKGFLWGGAGGQVTSYHFTVDNNKAIQLIPINEVSWQAADGGGPGNMNGISCELCVGAQITSVPAEKRKSRSNAEELCAAVTKAMGIPTTRVKRHWDFNYNNSSSARHHCPDQMMNDGYWDTFVSNVGKLQGGATINSASEYSTPVPPMVGETKWDGLEDVTINSVIFNADKREITTAVETNRRLWASTVSAYTGPAYPIGAKVKVLGWVEGEDVDDELRWWITEDGSRVSVTTTEEDPDDRMQPTEPEVISEPETPVEPEPTKPVDTKPTEPEPAKPETPADNSPEENGPVILDGRLYYVVGQKNKGRDVFVYTDTSLYQRASLDSKKMSSAKAGDVVKAVMWCAGDAVKQEEYWWILAAKDGNPIMSGLRIPMSATGQRPS